MMLPRLLFAYLALFQIILLVVSYFMNQEAPEQFAVNSTAMVLLAAALVAFALGFILPRRMVGKIKAPCAGTGHPLSAVITPYIVRLCLFETCSVLGFVAGFLHQDWHVMVPFVVLGLIGTASSAPTEAFFANLRNG